jgi:serine/threonine-protein kinase HipA
VKNSTSDRAYVWVWLPGAADPVPAGLLQQRGADLWFRYGERYLARPEALSLYGPELPLGRDWVGPAADLGMPGALRGAAPDAWGRRVLLDRLTGARGRNAETADLPDLVYLLASASNRFGAIDFQASPDNYAARGAAATLEQLQRAAELVEAGASLPLDLKAAALNGTTLGGARPKAVVVDGGRELIAKFGTSSDPWSVVGAEATALELARRAGIEVAASATVRSLGRDVLLAERFDRLAGGGRRMAVTGLTILGLGEMTARYGTYPALLEAITPLAKDPERLGRDLFARIAFNIAISNTDDHLRNHAAFWDGHHLELTPAYDLTPMPRSGETAFQALAYGADGARQSSFPGLVRAAHVYGLTKSDAAQIVGRTETAVLQGWNEAADAGRLTAADRALLWGRQFLNPATRFDT